MKKILVVDDDDMYRDFVAAGLKNAGYEVSTARDGQEGVAAARSLRPELMILDLNMPVMNGFDVCQKIREDRELSGLKIIVTSAKSYIADIRKAKELGADLYVSKPCDFESLLKAVKSL